MFGMFRKNPVIQSETGSLTDGEGGYNPLSGLRIENDSVVYITGHVEQLDSFNDNEETEDRSRLHDTVMRLYGPEKFTRHVCGVLGWVGRKKGLQSLQVDPADEDFGAALAVVHRRLMDGPLGPVINRLSDQAFEDLLIITVGVAPVVVATVQEVANKKRRPAVVAVDASETGEEDER